MPKFKRYKNKYTNSPRIYSMEDFLNMSVGNMTRREKELTSQYKQIGLPTTSELKNSSNVVYVNEYTRGDGTVVHAHWRSKPENSVITETAMPSNYEIDTEEHWPENWPTKAPDGPIEEGGDNDSPLGEIFGGIGGAISIVLQVLPLVFQLISMFSDNNNVSDTPVNVSISNNNSIPSVDGIDIGSIDRNLHTEQSNQIDPKTFVQDFVDKMVSSTSPSKPVQITAQGTPIKIDNVSNQSFGKASADKAQLLPENKGISFEQNKKTNLQRINQPIAQHLSADLEKYANDLLKTSQNKSNSELKDKFVKFITDFAKGGVQNYSSIMEGIERRDADNQRKQGNYAPSDYEIKNRYAGLYGLPSDSHAYNIGKLISEILLLFEISAITIEGFPAIVTFLLYSAIQILASKTIKYARFEDNKKFTDGLINDTANYFLTELLTRGLVKVGDKTIVINALKEKLSELWKGIENFATKHVGKPISLANGTIAFKQYNGETATPQEFYERVLRNYYKKVKERANKREIVKKRLPNKPKEFIINENTYKEIWLPEKEYNAVHSAFTTYIMHTHYTEPTLIRCYGDYVYTAVLEEVDGQLLPTFVDKVLIKGIKK